MRNFDYSFLSQDRIPAGFVDSIAQFYELRGRVSAMESFPSQAEKIIDGSQKFIRENYTGFSICEADILNLHRQLAAPKKGGEYKKIEHVIIVRSDFRKDIKFSTIPAAETPEAMTRLITAYNNAKNDVNPLLLIPCFILDFLGIQPFLDIDFEMSRQLSAIMLYNSGFKPVVIEPSQAYYSALMDSARRWNAERNNYYPFMAFFISTLIEFYTKLDRQLALKQSWKLSKSDRIKYIVLSSAKPVSRPDIHAMLPDVSKASVELALAEMLQDGEIKKISGNRYALYEATAR